MINVMNYVSKPMNEVDKCLDSQLWHACAGGMVQMPPVNSKVFYFPQGHSEHANGNVDFGNFPRIPPYILCRVSSIKFMADNETDEVYAKIGLVPLRNNNDCDFDDEGLLGFDKSVENQENPASFAKTLTQSDANNGGGFSVPRYCAETIFPKLDYSAEPPVQTILVKDVHGQLWKFRHIYRGTPRRHLLTTGWSNFVNHKKLVAGDSIVFLREDNGDLCVGIRRAKRGIGMGVGVTDSSASGWNTGIGNGNSNSATSLYGGGFSGFLREDENKYGRNVNNGKGNGKVRCESVIEAATLAMNGQPFEVVYYPRASTPEFCVKASTVRVAMRIQWCAGMRFKMAFETEDSSRISWFMGTISSVQVDDHIRWPNSPWRLLQVAWDEPDLLQNVKRVSPWLVELVSNMPAIHLSPFSPPRKKLRIPQPPDFSLLGQLSMTSLLSNNIPAGIQGARRYSQFGSLSSPDVQFNKIHPTGLFPYGFPQHDYSTRFPTVENPENDDNISCLLTIGNSNQNSKKNSNNDSTKPMFVLFGQPILTEQQLSESCSDGSGSGSAVVQNGPLESSSDEVVVPWYNKEQKSELSLETGHCKVFMEPEDVGRTLDLSVFGSYEELYRKLADMFGIEKSDMLSNLLYRNAAGAVKHAGDEPFSEFLKTARRLTILMDSGSNNVGS